ncbi:16 kDa heat shock protein A [Caenispirillum salinarum AK4]|uniref:16 kDa heat shock protein A n=1 Tax=Caenispirillum salinarum AK4 TaxID=1238182 RepID=K9HQT6_9PROT|nr:Hsp20 family protein [Caenispirillum salinarum]EKV30796.1 16 kDa heat shock protein A [Caenispirillum salinarum AK4]
MRSYDLSPLHRFTVGFDNVSRLLDAATRLDDAALSYPPYNIEKLGADDYRVTMAVAGFAESDLDVTVEDSTLIVRGRMDRDETGDDAEPRTFLHRGIATRAFERRFELADHIKVEGARLVNGLLHVELKREVPEEKKPRRIAIGQGHARAIEHQAEDASEAA